MRKGDCFQGRCLPEQVKQHFCPRCFFFSCQLIIIIGKELDVESITVLADKGYYTGECLENCEQDKITTIVSKQAPPSSTGIQPIP